MSTERYKSYVLFCLICFIIKLTWTQSINSSKIIENKSKNRLYEDVIVELESDEDIENYEEFYTSEMIPIKYWSNDKKKELQEQILDNIEISAVDNSTYFKFYNQLSSLEQNYYDYILDKSRESPPSFSVKVSINRDTNLNEFVSELDLSSEKVFTALVYDNPELWWLGTYQLKLGYTTTKYIITFITIPDDTSFSVYTPDDIVKLNNEIEVVKNSIMNEISRLNLKTKYAIMRYIHDYLIVKNVYTLDENLRHIRTIYGALVENRCVCEGYSEAFQYIAHQYGINCIIGRSSTHEWNFVEIDGKWYILDATYDDPTSNGKSPPSNSYTNLKTTYFLIGTEHICNFNKKYSDDKDHILVYSGFSSEILVSYPSIEADDYIPSNLELEEIELINLSEIAAFTATNSSFFTTSEITTESSTIHYSTTETSSSFTTSSTINNKSESSSTPTATTGDEDFYNYTIPDSSLSMENETISSSFETVNIKYNISIIYISLIFLINIFLLV